MQKIIISQRLFVWPTKLNMKARVKQKLLIESNEHLASIEAMSVTLKEKDIFKIKNSFLNLVLYERHSYLSNYIGNSVSLAQIIYQ